MCMWQKVKATCLQVSRGSEEGARCPGPGVIGGYESPNMGAENWIEVPLEEQQLLLVAKPSLPALISSVLIELYLKIS